VYTVQVSAADLDCIDAERLTDCSCVLAGIHPTTISDSFQKAAAKSSEILEEMSTVVHLTDRESLLQSATTALNSKVSKIFVVDYLCAFSRLFEFRIFVVGECTDLKLVCSWS